MRTEFIMQKSVLLTNLVLNIINEFDKIYIYSPSLHQDLYQKLINCFSNYIPIHIIPNILNEEDIDIVIDEVVNTKDFEKSDTKTETFDNIEELKYPQEYEYSSFIILDDLNEKEILLTIKYRRCLKVGVIIIYLYSF